MNVFDKVNEQIDDIQNGKHEHHPFYMFEPWDVEERDPEIYKKAEEDGFDLFNPELVKYVGSDPHPFQSGYFLSTKKLRVLLAGSQVGKSKCPRIEVFIMATGEIPFSMRYNKGVNTGIKRTVDVLNIDRFGRFDSKTGEFIDKNKNAKPDDSWDCGEIVGVGIYPQEKIAPPGSQIWVGTFQEPKTTYWWPQLAENIEGEFPDDFYDRTKANDGLNKTEGIIFTKRNCRIIFLTYEMGYKKFEAQMAHAYVADEEMPNAEIFNSAQQHARFRSITMTPLNGMTWSKKVIFPEKKNNHIDVFHATQYDSPYQDKKDLEEKRKTMESWARGSRIWGLYSEVKGEPFFGSEGRTKLIRWASVNTIRAFKYAGFSPTKDYFGIKSQPNITPIPGLLDTPVSMQLCQDDNKVNTWRIYEDRKAVVGYALSADPSEGAETPEAVGDICAAGIMRPPVGDEKKPVIVATIRSTTEVIAFARICSFALRHYNNALLMPERGRGSANATFGLELDDWPHWGYTTTTQNSTGLQRKKKGFDTNSATRDIIFDLIRDWIDMFDIDEYSYICDEPLLRELAAAIVTIKGNGAKRCDHTNDGTLDSAIWFGILCYLFKNNPEQVKCNVKEISKKNAHSRFVNEAKHNSFCGMTAMGYRKVGVNG